MTVYVCSEKDVACGEVSSANRCARCPLRAPTSPAAPAPVMELKQPEVVNPMAEWPWVSPAPAQPSDDFTDCRPPMRHIAGVSEETLRRAAVRWAAAQPSDAQMLDWLEASGYSATFGSLMREWHIEHPTDDLQWSGTTLRDAIRSAMGKTTGSEGGGE